MFQVPHESIRPMNNSVHEHLVREVVEVEDQEHAIKRHTHFLEIDQDVERNELRTRREIILEPVTPVKVFLLFLW